jgi:hypothetical protein
VPVIACSPGCGCCHEYNESRHECVSINCGICYSCRGCSGCVLCGGEPTECCGSTGCIGRCGEVSGGDCRSPGQLCCGNQCYDPATQKCCYDIPGVRYVIDKGKECCNGTGCDSANCESCVDGSCQVCGGDTNKKCCNGSCCDKVWIKKTIPAINESCPSCVGNHGCAENHCKIASSYDECSNVGIGSGEHCQCHSQEQPIGYIYHCINNFDVSKLLWCALRGGWCAAVCIETMDPAECANCLAEASESCCDGPCELCDFIESCDPDTEEGMIPVVADVFTDFGC